MVHMIYLQLVSIMEGLDLDIIQPYAKILENGIAMMMVVFMKLIKLR